MIATPDRRKVKRVCHVNLLKKYFERDQRLFPPVNVPACNVVDVSDSVETESVSPRTPLLSGHQSCELNDLLSEFDDIFSEEPGKTHLVEHHIKLTPGATPRDQLLIGSVQTNWSLLKPNLLL